MTGININAFFNYLYDVADMNSVDEAIKEAFKAYQNNQIEYGQYLYLKDELMFYFG